MARPNRAAEAASRCTVGAAALDEMVHLRQEGIAAGEGNRVVKLWDAVRAKLAGKEALVDFEESPEDADAQGALRVQLKKALEADPAFQEEVVRLVGELEAKGGRQAITQTATITGGAAAWALAGVGFRRWLNPTYEVMRRRRLAHGCPGSKRPQVGWRGSGT